MFLRLLRLLAAIHFVPPAVYATDFSVLLRVGEIEPVGEERGVGVEELHQAVAVGGGGAQVLPVHQIGAGLEIEALPGGARRLQQNAPVGLLLDKRPRRVFDEDHFGPARRRRFIAGDIDIAIGIHRNRIPLVIPIPRPIVALQPDLIAIAVIFDRHNVVARVCSRRVAGDIDIVRQINSDCGSHAYT